MKRAFCELPVRFSEASCWSGLQRATARGGFVLLVVTVVILLLSLASYSYMSRMDTENRAAAMYGRDVEARMAAESAVEYVATMVSSLDTYGPQEIYHSPSLFSRRLMEPGENPRGQLRFSVVSPDSGGGLPRAGLTTETAKFNLNRLLEMENDVDEISDPWTAVSMVPNMTEDICNAILDWIDSDEDVRLGGAESATYEGLLVPYAARNAPMLTIEELLQIQGVTPALFYGEDANRNGRLDPNEDDGADSLPLDNGDGILDLGFRDYFTVSSRERNTLVSGDPRLNINNGIIAEMFDLLEENFDTDTAIFVTAYRLNGDLNADAEAQGMLTIEQQQLVDWIAKNIANGELGEVTRAGIDLSSPPQASFRSLYDLIDAKVEVEIEGSLQTLDSPWRSDDPAGLLEQMLVLEENLTWINDDYFDGRININMASFDVLMGIPEMTESLADEIIASRPAVEDSTTTSAMMANRVSPIWLLTEGYVDVSTFKRLGPWITTRGDLYSFQVLGHFDEGGPTTRLEAMIDATARPPRIFLLRDLSPLGRGYEDSLLEGSQ